LQAACVEAEHGYRSAQAKVARRRASRALARLRYWRREADRPEARYEITEALEDWLVIAHGGPRIYG
jgi:hypothetical protein